MNALEKANIPEFIRSNDGTNRITNLAEFTWIIDSLTGEDALFLFEQLLAELKRFRPILTLIKEQMHIQTERNLMELCGELIQKLEAADKIFEEGRWAEIGDIMTYIDTEQNLLVDALLLESWLEEVAFGDIVEYTRQLSEVYEMSSRVFEREYTKYKKGIAVRRTIYRTTAIVVVLIWLSVLAEKNNIFSAAREKIHQILSSQE